MTTSHLYISSSSIRPAEKPSVQLLFNSTRQGVSDITSKQAALITIAGLVGGRKPSRQSDQDFDVSL